MSQPPLAGQRVVVTRAAHQAEPLVAAFESAGATVQRWPLLELTPPPDPAPLAEAARRPNTFDWVVLTSANAADAFLPLVKGPLTAPVAVVGPATAGAARRHGAEPELVAGKSRAQGLVESLAPRLGGGSRVLLPQAEDARDDLARGLRALGAEVTRVVAYGKRLPAEAAAAGKPLLENIDTAWVTVTSPRIARHLARLFGQAWEHRRSAVRALSIGGATSGELRRLGVEPAAEATSPSDNGLVAALIQALEQTAGTPLSRRRARP